MLIISLLYILSWNAVTLRRDRSILFNRIAILLSITASLLALASLYFDSLSTGIGLHGGLFHSSSITQSFQIFILIVNSLILTLTGFYPLTRIIRGHGLDNNYSEKIINNVQQKLIDTRPWIKHARIIEYPLIIMFVIVGATFLMSTSDLVSIFLAIELQSYGLYLISTIYRNSELATSGGLTYFLLGGLSSCFILLGAGLLYANSGNSNLESIYIITSLSDITEDKTNLLYWYKPYYISFSFVVLSVGFLFKVSAAPFHFWAPDVYDAIPTVVTTFVANIAKVSIFIFLLELVHYTSVSLYEFDFALQTLLLISCFISLIIGTVAGLTQFRIKRLLAYSTISHVGFILLALAINTIESNQAFFFYLIQYTISNVNAFVILIAIGYSLHNYRNEKYYKLFDKVNSPIQFINQLKGYFYINPLLGLSLAIAIFSFAGIPPLVGFFAKQMVLTAALDSGYVFLSLVAILTSVISAVYYLNIVKEIFFFNPEYINKTQDNYDKFKTYLSNKEGLTLKNTYHEPYEDVLSDFLTIVISILTLLSVLFIFIPKQILSMANILALFLFNC